MNTWLLWLIWNIKTLLFVAVGTVLTGAILMPIIRYAQKINLIEGAVWKKR